MEMLFLVTGILVFSSGLFLGVLASSLYSWLIDEISERSPADRQIDTVRVTEAILRRHQEVCPDSSKQRQMNVAGAAAVLMLIAGTCLLLDYNSLHEMNRNRVVAPRQQSAVATVTAEEPAGHNKNRYRYEFSVTGSSYSGWDWEQPAPPATSRIGQKVTVYYDPEDPTVNAMVRFEYSGREWAWNIVVGLIAILFVATVAFVSILVAKNPRKHPAC